MKTKLMQGSGDGITLGIIKRIERDVNEERPPLCYIDVEEVKIKNVDWGLDRYGQQKQTGSSKPLNM